MDIRFDDIEALRKHIGAHYGPWSEEFTVTQKIIDRFADLTGDHQWIHVDVERAKDGPFGTTIAHGFLTLALTPRYRPSLGFNVVGEGSRVNYGCESYRFLAPVPVDSTLHSRAKLVDVRERPQGTLLLQELMVSAVDSPKPALAYTGMLLYRP